ncbi:MAG: family 43 glycosylhydrolase [Ignavibacteria bacterium]|nr:family 43 glycosylhydrolase [Ignavibacteria bacterium]
MRDYCLSLFTAATLFVIGANDSFAQNPIITNQFTADPAARVFEGRVYLYPSHDILATEGRGRVGWFCMEDYHVFSSDNLSDWTDHGVIVSQATVPWVRPLSYALWAPDCIARNGKYYFYFPAPAKDTTFGRGFSIGVAVAEKPSRPFVPLPEPMKNVHGIDPCPFIDKDGQAYLYWAARNIYVAKLKENMLELAAAPKVIEGLPDKGLKEGPSVFERNGIYYLTYPHVQDTTERLEYAVGDNPMGPFKVTGVIMDETPDCWTNQQSIIEFRNQWYLFYHHNDLSPRFDKNRSVRIDSLFFNEDGTIRKVIPTLRGVGLTDASKRIQIDRYSRISNEGTSVAFMDTLNSFGGWKTILGTAKAWIQYDGVDFGIKEFKSIIVRALSQAGGTLQIRLNKVDGPVIAQVEIPAGKEWHTIKAHLSGSKTGVHNLVVSLIDHKPVEVDWVSFE